MAKIILYDATSKTHRPAAVGDKLEAAQLISSDANNAATVGVDGGLYVSPQATFVDDQVMTGTTTSTATLAMTPTVAGNGDVNYSVAATVRVSATAGNQLVVQGDGLHVPAATLVAATAPAIIEDGTTPTRFYGGNSIALGAPDGFMLINGKKVGYWN